MPAWARLKSLSNSTVNPPFQAGAALAHLDAVVRADPAWAGCWRQRLALRCATASARDADEAALRDAWHLSAAGDPGPAGRAYGAWRDLARRGTHTPSPPAGFSPFPVGSNRSQDPVIRACQDLGFAAEFSEAVSLDALPEAPLEAAAAAVAAVVARDHRAEPLGLWLADQVLAARLRWPVPVPLLAAAIGTAARDASGRRVRAGEGGFPRAVALALAQAATRAVDLAGEIARRSAVLEAVAPKLRAKGAGAVVAALLDDDAVSGSGKFSGLSDRGARRLFDRLVALGAVRELTGRASFRLYGL